MLSWSSLATKQGGVFRHPANKDSCPARLRKDAQNSHNVSGDPGVVRGNIPASTSYTMFGRNVQYAGPLPHSDAPKD